MASPQSNSGDTPSSTSSFDSSLSSLTDPQIPGASGLSILWRLRDQLVAEIEEQIPASSAKRVIEECISTFFTQSFQVLPICHEPSIRESAGCFFGSAKAGELTPVNHGHGQLRREDTRDQVKLMRSFTLLTALCASMSFVHSNSFIPHGSQVGPLFLCASRGMLKVYMDYDIQHPDCSSLQIRMLYSSSFHHYAGHNALGSHSVSEACLLARRLRLFTEAALSHVDPLEATMLRLSWWSLYIADQSGICTRERAVTLYQPFFDAVMDIRISSPEDEPLLGTTQNHREVGLEASLRASLHVVIRICASAAELLLTIRSFTHISSASNPMDDTPPTQVAKIAQMYAEYDALAGEIPPERATDRDTPTTSSPESYYILRRLRAQVVYHGFKLMIIHECAEKKTPRAIGCDGNPECIDRAVANAAYDFIQALNAVPFHHVQTLGEPVVRPFPMNMDDHITNTSRRRRKSHG